jgi:hypothetical protein
MRGDVVMNEVKVGGRTATVADTDGSAPAERKLGRPKKTADPALLAVGDEELERIRMTVDFPPAATRRLKYLKDKLEAPSYIDVLRNALKLYEKTVNTLEEGGRVTIVDETGDQVPLDVPTAA